MVDVDVLVVSCLMGSRNREKQMRSKLKIGRRSGR